MKKLQLRYFGSKTEVTFSVKIFSCNSILIIWGFVVVSMLVQKGIHYLTAYLSY